MRLLDLVEKSLDCFFACLPRATPKQSIVKEARLIAHRGAHDQKQCIIENTHAAFARALALGCWGIELDVHVTADGVLVINHDPTLLRLWGKKVAINELDFKTLHQLVPEIPTLTEVVAQYGKQIHLFIELKTPFTAEAALEDTLQTLEPCKDYHLISLNESLFASFRIFPLEAMLLVPVHNNLNQFCDYSLQKHYGGVLGHYVLFRNKRIKQLKSAQQVVGVGLINSKFALYRELNRGLSWIFTNQVGLLSDCLKELQGKTKP